MYRRVMDVIHKYDMMDDQYIDMVRELGMEEEHSMMYVSYITHTMLAYTILKIAEPGKWRIMAYNGDIILVKGDDIVSVFDRQVSLNILRYGEPVCTIQELMSLLHNEYEKTMLSLEIEIDTDELYELAYDVYSRIMETYPPCIYGIGIHEGYRGMFSADIDIITV